MKNVAKILTVAASALLASSAAYAGSAHGVWLHKDTGAHIKAYSCGGGLGLMVAKSSKQNQVGKVIMCGAKNSGDNKWKGKLKNLTDGNTYSGTVQYKSNDTLKLSGCALGGLVCKRQTWTRVK